jgi:hypothetical protein
MLYLRHYLSFALSILVFSAPSPRSEAACYIGEIAEFPVTMAGLRPMIPVTFNGTNARLVVDSGAFYSALSQASAVELKLKPSSADVNVRIVGVKPSAARVNFKIVGPSGEFVPELAQVKQFSINDVPLTNIQFLVGGTEPGASFAGLLGQNILGIADVEYDLAHGVIRFMKPHDCGQTPLAYWAASPAIPYSLINIDPGTKPRPIHTIGEALLNGTLIRVVFDTGAPTSMLTLAAARRAGVRPDSAGVTHASASSWIGLFSSLKIDTEEMRNVRLRFGNFSMEEGDMLLGADFFLSHRVYVANSQDKLYFTYNGGPPFDLTSMPSSVKAGLLSIRFDRGSELPYFEPGCGCGGN